MTGHLVDTATATLASRSQPVLIYTIAEACAVSKVGRTAIFAAIRDGHLVARKCGRRTLIHTDDLKLWIAGFPIVKPNPR